MPVDSPPNDATQRFSSRVENYIRYRPLYPQAVIDVLRTACQLSTDSVVADIGSGTGILAELFLGNGNRVYGVEPNREMREAGERLLSAYANFQSVDGAAETTTLGASSVDFVVAGQAFHWFNLGPARVEFERILKRRGWVALVWNKRVGDATPFGREYEALLYAYATDYAEVSHQRIDDALIDDFFGGGVQVSAFPNRQYFDFDGLKGRLLSSSYSPIPGSPLYDDMLAALAQLFVAYRSDGEVAFDYETNLYYGRLSRS